MTNNHMAGVGVLEGAWWGGERGGVGWEGWGDLFPPTGKPHETAIRQPFGRPQGSIRKPLLGRPLADFGRL